MLYQVSLLIVTSRKILEATYTNYFRNLYSMYDELFIAYDRILKLTKSIKTMIKMKNLTGTNRSTKLLSLIKIIIPLILISNCCISCSGRKDQKKSIQTESINQQENSEQKKIYSHLQTKENNKAQVRRTLHQNGLLKSEGHYINNKKEGLHREWADSGILELEGFYSRGKANGSMKWYHEKGHLAAEGNMIDDIREGPWRICDIEENGFCIDAYFKNGKRDGIWLIYHENTENKLWKEQTFKDDIMISEKCWDVNGNLIECL